MGFFGDLLDDLGPDGFFATPEERAQQRGVRRAKEELAHRQHLDQADPNATTQPAPTPAPPSRRGFFGNLMDDLGPEDLFATPEERAAQHGSRLATEAQAYRNTLAEAEAETTRQTAHPPPDTPQPLTGINGWMLMGLLAVSPVLVIIAVYLASRFWDHHLMP